jgi:hypothetical protein
MSANNQQLIFWAVFLALSGLIIFFDQKYQMLRDISTARIKSFSYARVQLAWWTVLVLSAFIAIMITKGAIPTFDSSTLILLGISAGTTGAARIIDQSDLSNPAIVRGQDEDGQDFFLDILSDGRGVDVHRFQAVVFNLVFGIWFIVTVLNHLTTCNPAVADCLNTIIPKIENNNLILLGLSSGTYAALKATENKVPVSAMQDKVPDESGQAGQGLAQG